MSKRFILKENGVIDDTQLNILLDGGEDKEDMVDLLNELNDGNEQLKQSVNNLKETIIKITIAYQRKYDRTIVDLVDEVHDEDITDLIKELQE